MANLLIRLRRGTALEWTEINPVLSEGEPGFEKDTGKLKLGDGISQWADLDYFIPGAGGVGSGGDGTTSAPMASPSTPGIVELATLAEVASGTDTTRAVTPHGLRQERLALRTEILGADVPSALDTLNELAAALSDDANFSATITTSLANRLRIDTANQGLTSTQQSNGRANLSAVGTAQIGNEETDLLAIYNNAKA